jgi:hypothetical protein
LGVTTRERTLLAVLGALRSSGAVVTFAEIDAGGSTFYTDRTIETSDGQRYTRGDCGCVLVWNERGGTVRIGRTLVGCTSSQHLPNAATIGAEQLEHHSADGAV